MSDDLAIKARVVGFTENAMHRHFRHREYHAFDVTVLEILEPHEMKGNKLSIYHDKREKLDSVWRRLDAVLKFRLSEKTLKINDSLYTGAIKELREDTLENDNHE